MCCTWLLSAAPVPTTACLIFLASYSKTARPRLAPATMAAPRAWPSFNAESALLAIKTFSMASSSGPYCWIISVTPANISTSFSARLALMAVRMQPLATYSWRLPWALTRPNPVIREPGSMPRINAIVGSSLHPGLGHSLRTSIKVIT